MVLFDDDNDLSDEEIRKLLKRGLKKKKELDVNVAQDFFGLEKGTKRIVPKDEGHLGSKTSGPLEKKETTTRAEEVRRTTITEKTPGDVVTGGEKDALKVEIGLSGHLSSKPAATSRPTEIFKIREGDSSLDESSSNALKTQVQEIEKSVTQLEESMEQTLEEATSTDETIEETIFLKQSPDEVIEKPIRGEEEGAESINDLSSVSNDDKLAETSESTSIHSSLLNSSTKNEIKELRVLVRTLYKLVESVIVQMSMLTGDKEAIPEVISKLLVALSEWNDVEQYPDASTIYTELSRLRSRIKKLPDQSLITEIIQEAMRKHLEKLEQGKSEPSSVSSAATMLDSLPPPEDEVEEPSESSEHSSLSMTVPSVLDEEIQIGQFHRTSRAKDYWSYIVSSGQLMESYQHISDLIIPLYWRYALIEIHRYRIDDPILLRHVIKIPAELLNDIIRKLLREAPTSRLLQRIKQKRLTDQLLSEFLPNELRDKTLFIKIRESVERYLEYFTNVQKGILSFEDVKILGEQSLKSFELGPNEIETRIPLAALNVLRELRERIPPDNKLGERSFKNERYLEAVCGYLTIYLVNELNRHFVNESKFYTLLERLKQS